MCVLMFSFFLVYSHNCEGQMLASPLSVCLSVCPSAWNLPPTGQIFLKLCTCGGAVCFTKTIQTSQGQIFALLTCYAVWIGSQLPMFQDDQLVLKSLITYQPVLRNIPEERKSHLRHGGSLISHKKLTVCYNGHCTKTRAYVWLLQPLMLLMIIVVTVATRVTTVHWLQWLCNAPQLLCSAVNISQLVLLQ